MQSNTTKITLTVALMSVMVSFANHSCVANPLDQQNIRALELKKTSSKQEEVSKPIALEKGIGKFFAHII